MNGWKWINNTQLLIFIIGVLLGAIWIVLEIKYGQVPESSVGWASWA